MRALEWLVLLPLWRRLIPNKMWHAPAALGTGAAWLVIIILIAVASGGGDDDDDEAASGIETPTPTVAAAPTDEPTEASEPTPEPTPQPTPTEIPEPTGPATTFGSGTFIVGDDIESGTYTNSGSGVCYWERVRGFGGAVARGTAVVGRQIVTIAPTDASFTSNGCGTWAQDLSAVTGNPTDSFSDGMYQVGVDVAAGTWRNDDTGSELCYFARLSGFTSAFEDIIANEAGEGQYIVTIGAGDVGFQTRGCGTWSKVQ